MSIFRSKGYMDGREGKSPCKPNGAFKYTFASPVGNEKGSAADLNRQNKEYEQGYYEGKRDRER